MELSSLRQRKDDFICLDSSPTRSMTSQEQSRRGTPSEPQRTSSPTIPREYVDTVKSTAKLMNNEKIGMSGIPLSACVPADSKYRIKCISGLNAPQGTRVYERCTVGDKWPQFISYFLILLLRTL